MPIYNSRKISELRARNVITKHQENSWLVVAQYNNKTDSYTNITLPIKAITDYSYAYATSYATEAIANTLEEYYAKDWLKLRDVGLSYTMDELAYNVAESDIASNVTCYSFAYTVDYMKWQKFI